MAVVNAFEPQAWALGAWEGGSAAFGQDDEYSDIDIQLIVAPGSVPQAFELLGRVLEEIGGVAYSHRVPEPAWHGHSQGFYQLKAASPVHMLDILFIDADRPFTLTERELHGEPKVLFDKEGRIQASELDWSIHKAAMQARLEVLRQNLPLFLPLVEKEVPRGRPLDAIAFYHSMLLRPLVELLRMKFDPARYTFGLRYLHNDLPAEVSARLTRLAYVADLDDLAVKLAEGKSWALELIEELSQMAD
jgi:hypothetical protein